MLRPSRTIMGFSMIRISSSDEKKLARALLIGVGMCEQDAETVAEVVTHSDLTGVYSHGLSRLAAYLKQFMSGGLNAAPQMKLLRDEKAVLSYECDNGSGIVAANMVYGQVLDRARQYGIAIGTGKNSANIGCGSYYAEMGAKEGFITLMCCNTYVLMAPYGGAEPLLGTNPIIIGVPAGDNPPVILDMATTLVAMGKVAYAKREGTSIPDTWGSDAAGLPVTDPNKVVSLQPMAGYKGYGLAVMVDMFSAVLSQACFGRDIGSLAKFEPENTGFCIAVIDPSKFMPLDEFKKRVDDYISMIKGSRKAEGSAEIYLPGELEYRKREAALKTGVEIGDALLAELTELAIKENVAKEGETLGSIIARL